MIKFINFKLLIMYQYICMYYMFNKKYLLTKNFSNTNLKLNLLLKRKTLFFKKKSKLKITLSRRLSHTLRRRKNYKTFFIKSQSRVDYGNFFFKKFFFKTLLNNRTLLKILFCWNKKIRQKNLTKKIFKFKPNHFNLVNCLIRGRFFFFQVDALAAFKQGIVYLNNTRIYNPYFSVNQGDLIQIFLSKHFFRYLGFCRRFFRTKIKLHRFKSYRFYRQKYFAKLDRARIKKRKNFKYVYYFVFFKFNVPAFLEVDYLTLSIFLLKQFTTLRFNNLFYNNKLFSFRMFNLYNFKKIN